MEFQELIAWPKTLAAESARKAFEFSQILRGQLVSVDYSTSAAASRSSV